MDDIHTRTKKEADRLQKELDDILESALKDPSKHEKLCSIGADYLQEVMNKVLDEQNLLVDMNAQAMKPRLRRIFAAIPPTQNSAFHRLFRMWTRVQGSTEDKQWLMDTELGQVEEIIKQETKKE